MKNKSTVTNIWTKKLQQIIGKKYMRKVQLFVAFLPALNLLLSLLLCWGDDASPFYEIYDINFIKNCFVCYCKKQNRRKEISGF